MGTFYHAIVFYGVLFKEKEYSALLNRIERELYGHATRNRHPDFTPDLIQAINRVWEERYDPIRLSQRGMGANTLHMNESFHSVLVGSDYNEKVFQLDVVDTDRWDRLLQMACAEFAFPWSEPTFHVGGYARDGAEGAIFFYGLTLYEQNIVVDSDLLPKFGIDKETYVKLYTDYQEDLYQQDLRPDRVVDALNHHWCDAGVPLTLREAYYGWRDYPGSKLYHLVINQTRQTCGRFQLDGADLAPWDGLVRAKCARYKVQGKVPSFYLYLRQS